MKTYNVLVIPGGTEIGLEIHKALSPCKNVRVIAAGQDFLNHAPYVYEKFFIVSSVYQNGWIDQLNKVIHDEHIDYIFPAHDDVIVALSENAEKIHAKIVTSPINTCLITRSKSKTYTLLKDIIPVPDVYDNPGSVTGFPVFLKPDKGQGSQGTHICHNQTELDCFFSQSQGNIILEYLPGKEYTIDCFSDRERGLLFCQGRVRARVKNGIAMNCHAVNNPIFLEYAKKISERLQFHGAWFFQLKENSEDTCKLLEIGPRIAGTMAFHRCLGVNFPLLSIYEQERIPFEIMVNNIEISIDRALINRFKSNLEFSSVYIDLDDTLSLNEKINLDLIKFIFKCLNERKKIVLITKHDHNIEQTLKKYRISHLFDEIIHINKNEEKSDYIHEKNAIFIDDSFSERKKIHDKKNIMTFDCSMLEMLE